MRKVVVLVSGLVLSCGLVFGQAMSDFGAVAAGSTVGGAAGKPVSNALSSALRGVSKATSDAAQTTEKDAEKEKPAPVKESSLPVVPSQPAATLASAPKPAASKSLPSFKALTTANKGVAKLDSKTSESQADSTVELSPEERAKVFESAPSIAGLFELPSLPEDLTPKGDLAEVLPRTPLMPPPVMTAASFKNVTAGMTRTELLRLGAPQFKVTMDEDGHLAELYSYTQEGQRLGSVKLVDGAVAIVRP